MGAHYTQALGQAICRGYLTEAMPFPVMKACYLHFTKGKQRHRKGKGVTQGHTAGQWQGKQEAQVVELLRRGTSVSGWNGV